MSYKQKNLLEVVKDYHGSQKRKYTNEPYVNHLINVALSAQKAGIKFGYEIGLCHDLLEDTTCTGESLFGHLCNLGYGFGDSQFIVSHVVELTDVFTTESFPYLNRKIRKQCEALRLHSLGSVSQSIKCLDLIDNTSTIIEHDLGFAKTYIPEKRAILIGLNKAIPSIKSQAMNFLLDAEDKLKVYKL